MFFKTASKPSGEAKRKEPRMGMESLSREDVERLVEEDSALVPRESSALLVEPAVLDPEEIQALLAGLSNLLAGETELIPGPPYPTGDPEENCHEPDAPTT